MTIGFAGMSHLGLVSSLAAASKGFDVVCYDPDATRCTELQAGIFPIVETGLEDLFATHGSRVTYTADAGRLASCSLVYVAIDVPTASTGVSDLRPVTELVHEVDRALPDDAWIVVLSQVAPGFTRTLRPSLRAGRGLIYQVETLIFGVAVERALHPERIIVGCDQPDRPLPADYRAFLDAFTCPVLSMRYESAELTKIAINMFLVSSVSTTNTLAEICEAIGADWSEIAPALRLDRRIGEHAYLSPGLGIAGGNLERDLATIAGISATCNTDAGVVDAWRRNSEHRKAWAFRVLQTEALGEDTRVGLWGLAYKAGTASTKNSPALDFLDAVHPIPVRAYDPEVRLRGDTRASVLQVDTPLAACQDADALAVLTPWPEFRAVSLAEAKARMRGSVIIDPYGILDRQECQTHGFKYRRLGVPMVDGSNADA